jgi:hypothetical protein
VLAILGPPPAGADSLRGASSIGCPPSPIPCPAEGISSLSLARILYGIAPSGAPAMVASAWASLVGLFSWRAFLAGGSTNHREHSTIVLESLRTLLSRQEENKRLGLGKLN